MKKILRKAIIAGNWKMNKTRQETKEFINKILPLLKNKQCEVIIGTPFIDLETAIEMTKGSDLKVAAQNCHWAKEGAFTGEISGDMLKELGVEYVILGHSERRQYFGETDITVNKRIKAALNSGLKVIMCVGEKLEERELGITENIVGMQIKVGLNGISKEEMENIVIAYEPVWAIGTGKTATSEEANQVIHFIREEIEKIFDKNIADQLTIQYGGSMKSSNARELLLKEDIDGGLIGGASLDPHEFLKIINAAND